MATCSMHFPRCNAGQCVRQVASVCGPSGRRGLKHSVTNDQAVKLMINLSCCFESQSSFSTNFQVQQNVVRNKKYRDLPQCFGTAIWVATKLAKSIIIISKCNAYNKNALRIHVLNKLTIYYLHFSCMSSFCSIPCISRCCSSLLTASLAS